MCVYVNVGVYGYLGLYFEVAVYIYVYVDVADYTKFVVGCYDAVAFGICVGVVGYDVAVVVYGTIYVEDVGYVDVGVYVAVGVDVDVYDYDYVYADAATDDGVGGVADCDYCAGRGVHVGVVVGVDVGTYVVVYVGAYDDLC